MHGVFNMALTGRKQKFAQGKGRGLSNKDAAIAAGYSAASAAAAGSRLAKDPDVLAVIDRKAKAKVAKKVALPKAAAPVKAAAEVPPKFDLSIALSHDDPKKFLMAFMNDIEMDPKERKDAAKALMPFVHQKMGEGGKKDQQAGKAKQAASKFAPTAAPKLIVNNR